MRSFPDTLVTIIKKSDLNINQISMISGISNTYLTKLLRHRINHPGKDKIASVLLAQHDPDPAGSGHQPVFRLAPG